MRVSEPRVSRSITAVSRESNEVRPTSTRAGNAAKGHTVDEFRSASPAGSRAPQGRQVSTQIPAIDQHSAGSGSVNYCGPTALTMVMQGLGASPRMAAKAKDTPSTIRGLASEMGTGSSGTAYTAIEREAAEAGLNVHEFGGPNQPFKDAKDVTARIKQQIDKDRPVMIAVDFAKITESKGGGTTHYVVVTGYDDKGSGSFTVNDPWTGKTKTVPASQFEEAVTAAAGRKGWNQIAGMSFEKTSNANGVGSIVDANGTAITGGGRTPRP